MGWSTKRKTGLTQRNEKSINGYSVITPNGGDTAYLLGPDGKVVNYWRFPWYQPGHAYLTPEGTLLTRGRLLEETKNGWEIVPDAADIAVEFDWDGNVIWKWDKGDIHHGFYRMPNGNTLFIAWTPMPEGLRERLNGGLPPNQIKTIVEKDPDFMDFLLDGIGVGFRPKKEGGFSESIIEVDPQGNIVKQWFDYDHLSPEDTPLCPLCRGGEWLHANSISMTADGHVLVSFRQVSLVVKINWETGDIVWSHGRPHISHQHDPTETPDGNILIFDNGTHHPIQGRTSVVEIDPETKNVLWRYSGEVSFDFISLHIGGAERLPNGNTMICEGEGGRLFEVTPDKEICWEWVSPFVHDFKGKPNVQIFKTRTYAADSPELTGRDLSGSHCDAINKQYNL
ncbi:MAG: hypothetical protein HN580_29545 [Deltaproteobacteria bacterium]|nr:hypothetical protein [Deltaproteobacteria bacterium]MBT6615231.1 hypothetical protein [Deltaproteobacteria bacterium]MBT7893190.1 hypothetical protein [Deltaproteobacteria bacterium]